MILMFVRFETTLSEAEVMKVAEERAPDFRALPGLVQKFYVRLDKPNHYGGVYIWASREDLLAYRESDLARSIPTAYKVVGRPENEIHEVLFPLRADGIPERLLKSA